MARVLLLAGRCLYRHPGGDLATCEHKGPNGRQRLQILVNDGRANFRVQVIDRGKESHRGARLADLDGGGDLDRMSTGWRPTAVSPCLAERRPEVGTVNPGQSLALTE